MLGGNCFFLNGDREVRRGDAGLRCQNEWAWMAFSYGVYYIRIVQWVNNECFIAEHIGAKGNLTIRIQALFDVHVMCYLIDLGQSQVIYEKRGKLFSFF